MFKTFSIRLKILILLVSVSFTSGIVLLYVSIDTFKSDKISYIFETNTDIAGQFTKQLALEIQAVNQSAMIYIDRFSKTGNLTESPSDSIPDSFLLNGVQIFTTNTGSLKTVNSIKKNSVALLDVRNPLLNSHSAILPVTKKEFYYFNDQLIFLNHFTINKADYVLAYYYRSEILNTFFGSQASYKSYLLNSKGKVFLKGANSAADLLTTDFSRLLLNENSVSKLSTTIIKSDKNENWLMTTTPTPLKELKLVLLVDERKALSALNEIILKSVLIFIILFSTVVIIGVIAANYITSRLSVLSEHARKVTEGDFSSVIESRGNDEVAELAQHFNQMTKELTRLMNETAHKARMESELKTAQTVQETLLPKNEYSSPHIEIRGHYQSASECGGDWWSYSEDKDFVYIWISDATGHGVSAALLTSAAKSSVTLIEDMQLSAAQNIKILNKAICSVAKETLMMTCFHGIYNKNTRVLSYVNASHEPPILFKKTDAAQTKDDLIFLNENINTRLGYSLDSDFTDSEFTLATGDRIYFYTDGVQDISAPNGKNFGERRHIKNLLQILNENSDIDATTKNYILSLETYREQTELIDDVTFFFMETK